MSDIIKNLKLNGWQRLWVFIGVIYFILSLVVFISIGMPNKKDIERQWCWEAIEIIKDPEDYTYKIRDAYKEKTDGELIKSIYAKYGERPEYSKKLAETRVEYEHKIATIWLATLTHIFYYFLWLIIPLAILYLLGMGVGWVYRGFKKK